VHRLDDYYKDQVDFLYINIDLPETQAIRNQFEITDRAQYTLIDADGTIIRKWYGFLDEDELKTVIDEFLATT
jgi:hypothetical protein